MVLSEPPSCVRTPMSRIVWFPVKILRCIYAARTRSVSEPLPWVRNTKTGNRMVLSEPPSCVRTPRSRTIWFPVKILPYLCAARTRSVREPLPWVRKTKTGNSMVLSEPPSCMGTPRSRTVRFPVKILPCLYTTRTRSVKENISLVL